MPDILLATPLEIYSRLFTPALNIQGLNDEQRKKRLALFGENTDMSGGLYKWTKTHGSIKQQVQTKLEAYWVLIDSEWRKRPRYTTRNYMT
jgi:hypothetical protein